MRRGRDGRSRVAVVFCICATFVVLTACFEEELATEYLDSWLDTRTQTEQVANGTGRTGDEAADGILEAAETIDAIREADAIYVRARPLVSSHDTEQAAPLLDQAIALRPDDQRYRRDRGRVALLQDDAALARSQWDEMDRIAREQGYADTAWYLEGTLRDGLQGLTDLLTLHGTGEGYSAAQDARAVVIYDRLAEILERAAAQNTLVGNYERATTQLEAAKDYRESAAQHRN